MEGTWPGLTTKAMAKIGPLGGGHEQMPAEPCTLSLFLFRLCRPATLCLSLPARHPEDPAKAGHRIRVAVSVAWLLWTPLQTLQ